MHLKEVIKKKLFYFSLWFCNHNHNPFLDEQVIDSKITPPYCWAATPRVNIAVAGYDSPVEQLHPVKNAVAGKDQPVSEQEILF